MSNWANEGAAIRRFLILLVAVQPDCRARYRQVVEPDLPGRFRQAWLDYADWPDSQEAADRCDELEQWARGVTRPEPVEIRSTEPNPPLP